MVVESVEAFQLREPGVSYLVDFGPKTTILGLETGISGTIILKFQYDSLARPRRMVKLRIIVLDSFGFA